MSRWAALDDELARWRDVGRDAVLWWRDDDAAEMTPALDRLLELQRATSAPLSLAVVPARATEALAQRLVHEPGIDLLQHGYAHVNHGGAGEKKMELGLQRPAMIVLGDLGTGWIIEAVAYLHTVENLEEGVGHAATNDDFVRLIDEASDEWDLVGNFGAAEDGK